MVSGDESVRARYRSVVRTLRDRPWTVGVGWAVAIPAVVLTVALFGALTPVIEQLTTWFLLAVGVAGVRQGVFSRSVVAPEAAAQVTRGFLGLAALFLVFEVVRVLAVLPATAVVYRLDENRRAGRETDLRGVIGELLGAARTVLVGGLSVRLLAFVVFVFLLPLAAAVYLALGTALEAAAWTLNLSRDARTWILVFSAVVALFLARRVATALVYAADPAAVWDPDVGARSAIRRSVAAFLDSPRRALVDDAAASLPVVLVVLSPIAAVAVGEFLGAGTVAFLVSLPVLVFGLGTAIPVAALYRAETAPSVDHAARSRTPLRDRLPLGTIAVVVLLVSGLGVAGGWVRVADGGPTTDGPGSTTSVGSPTTDPGRTVAESLDAVGRGSVTTERSVAVRTVFPSNGTTEDWRQRQLWIARNEPADLERIVLFSHADYDDPRRWTGDGVYQGETAYGRAHVQYRATEPDPARITNARWGSAPQFPKRGIAAGALLAYNGNGTVADAEWRVVDRTDDRIAYETTNQSMVTRFTDVYEVRDGQVRVWVDRSTGRVRRIEARAARTTDADAGPGYDERRITVRVYGYGTTEVERPRGTVKGGFEYLIDVLFYRQW